MQLRKQQLKEAKTLCHSPTQEVTGSGFESRTYNSTIPAVPSTPHFRRQMTLKQHKTHPHNSAQKPGKITFSTDGTELLKIHGAPHYMKRLGNSLSRALTASVLFFHRPPQKKFMHEKRKKNFQGRPQKTSNCSALGQVSECLLFNSALWLPS